MAATPRTFPIQSSTNCTIPAIAQAYSLNVTVVPPGSLGFLTIWPSGQPRPNASTLNDPQGAVIANAAIVPAGTSGSVDVYASANTDLVIDINGYYAAQSGITLAQGSVSAPSLSFAGDASTGIFSAGAGVLSLSSGGTSRLTLRADGDLDMPGSIRKSGTLFLHNLGTRNTAVGLTALGGAFSGTDNTAAGSSALAGNSTGSENTATGSSALASNTTGVANTATGYRTLASSTTGGGNTATGTNALAGNTTGIANTATGSVALMNNTTGNYNNATGDFALMLNTTGDGNTATGQRALRIATGSYNTALGYAAGSSLTTGNYNIMIGNAGSGAPADDHTIRIGDVQTRVFMAGIQGVTTSIPAVNVLIDTNGQLGTVLSSRRYKEDISDMSEASAALMLLHPVTFRYKKPYADGSKPIDYGLIAEEVAEVYPDLVIGGADGKVETVQYQKLTPMC
jgi:hypothetical protein